jgi:hypothetical protein
MNHFDHKLIKMFSNVFPIENNIKYQRIKKICKLYLQITEKNISNEWDKTK